ncbi:hypothetical protein [Paraliomyxa miuraensis]|uniref:hypothetical protein n=1 Tax=Paraliomyxa miuraensis TaxID=376150 RepID=UPI00224E771B|nr:hypothetical protein [Paraliomyxa miuraensis]MCX4246326.1 hypothetical protein [Paraliomyxa miuraensis]
MACPKVFLRSALALAGGALLTACPGDPIVPSDTDPGTSGSTSDTEATCAPGQTQTCPCPGGEGTQVCQVDGSAFGPCDCSGLDSGTSGEPDPATGTTAEDTTTTGPLPCTSDEECTDVAQGECEEGVCGEDGMCVAQPVEFGTPCGSATADECTAPDSCDGDGVCAANDVEDGLACSTCATGQCNCSAGACGECNVFAPTNNFITPKSLEGWELTGSWGLYRQSPSSQIDGPTNFIGQVMGTDGNRVQPYPGGEVEVSYARTRPFPLPEMIAFLSWNVDEGGGLSDNKTVRVSVDGGTTWDTLVDCAVDPSWAMCQPSMDQDPAVFDLVQIPVPMGLWGQEGIVEFGYDSGDGCCGFEKGWFIDSLNVATECRCQDNSDCADVTGQCGTGLCAPSGECALQPMPADTACGDAFDNDCNGADTCDGVGYCRDNVQPTGLALCGDCPGGGVCAFCQAGQCIDCLSFSDFGDFNDPSSVAEWTVSATVGTADWGLYDAAPQNQAAGPVPFPNAPVYGTDGNRNPPYPGAESESSSVQTGDGVVPAMLTFLSWHVDEGGGFYDNKIIELTVDDGASWTTLVNCTTLPAGMPFCEYEDDGRLGTDWDPIQIDTSAWAGMTGRLRLSYITGDSCCSFERGWFIDDLNAFSISCNDDPFPP